MQALVKELISENKRLKREIARASAAGIGELRGIGSLVRKLERGLVEAARSESGRRRSPGTRKPVSEETRQKRLEALAKARAQRALNAQSKLIKLEEPTGGALEK